MQVLFAVSEVDGLLKTGGLADVARHLPLSLKELDVDCHIFMPFYRQVDELLDEPKQSFVLNSNEYKGTIHLYDFFGIPLYCVQIDEMFNRKGAYGENYQDYDDNALRFAYFNQAIVKFLEQFGNQLDVIPNIIHCNDWHTGLLPYFCSVSNDKIIRDIKTLLTIHNGAFQGIYPVDANHHTSTLKNLIPVSKQNAATFNFLELGINYADSIIAVSPNYAKELLTPLGSHHLYDTFKANESKLSGILNGCDYSLWNPDTDPYIETQYTTDTITDKVENKLALQKWAQLPEDKNISLFGMSCRLTEQKGLGFLLPAIEQAIQHDAQFIIAGTGDPRVIDAITRLQTEHPDKVYFFHDYQESVSHQIIAGSDIFLVPSLFEPCGLTQMHALAYGTLPLVRKVGGLADTVIDMNQPNGNGFVFDTPNVDSVLVSIQRAILLRLQFPNKFTNTQKRAMTVKFTWKTCAQAYFSEYKQLLLD